MPCVLNSKNRKPLGVPLNQTALSILYRQFGKHPIRVFTYNGKPIANANTRAWRQALKRADISNFRWHDLRHTWASWQRQNGTQLDELQKLGGWLSESMVRRYAHLSSEDISQASMRIDAIFDKLNLPKLTRKDSVAEIYVGLRYQKLRCSWLS